MIELSAGEVFAIVIAFGAFVFGIVAFLRANPQATPAAVDTEVTRRIAEMQANRELVDKMERAYQQNNEMQRRLFDLFAGGLRLVAPLTPITSDDVAADLLTDIQKLGQPDAAG